MSEGRIPHFTILKGSVKHMRVIIAGGRDFNDFRFLSKKCDYILHAELHDYKLEDLEFICGMANGADSVGKEYADLWEYPVKAFPAKWDDLDVENCVIKYNKFGKPYNALAGHNRNLEMALYAKEDNGVLIAFHDGVSTGTKNMISLAKKHKLKVFVVKY